MSNKKYNKQAVMHLLRSYDEFQEKLMKLADSGLNPFEFTEKYDEKIRVTIVLMVDPNATPSQIGSIGGRYLQSCRKQYLFKALQSIINRTIVPP